MRSCGVSLWAIMRMPVLLSAFLAFACLWVNNDVSPDAAFSRSIRRHAFRASDVTALIQPLEWLEAAGVVLRNDLTCDARAPLSHFNDDEGSFFKEYICDTGLMFNKFGIEAELFGLFPSVEKIDQ